MYNYMQLSRIACSCSRPHLCSDYVCHDIILRIGGDFAAAGKYYTSTSLTEFKRGSCGLLLLANTTLQFLLKEFCSEIFAFCTENLSCNS